MKIARLPAAAAIAVALAACATVDSRIHRNQAAFDSYPPAVQSKIRAGEVDVGFTKEQAAIALGRPDRVYSRKTVAAEQEVWAYGLGAGPRVGFGFGMMTGGPVAMGVDVAPPTDRGAALRVVFQNGVVVRVESRQG